MACIANNKGFGRVNNYLVHAIDDQSFKNLAASMFNYVDTEESLFDNQRSCLLLFLPFAKRLVSSLW